MLRAGALYFAIVIAFFIAVISASLIMIAAHYRNSYLKTVRYQRLEDNLESGRAYILSSREKMGVESLDLYGMGTDSLYIHRSFWGIYELVEMKAFIDKDTLNSKFLLGKVPDSVVLYLSDEDRPLSISGATRITGDALLPKSGLRQAYAEGKPYDGKQLVYNGQIKDSQRTLPKLDEEILSELKIHLEQIKAKDIDQIKDMKVPFGTAEKSLYLGKVARLEHLFLSGKVLLTSDSLITISASAKLEDVVVYAPIIKVEGGFRGSCQLFARDSLMVGESAVFDYPSALGILRVDGSIGQPILSMGKATSFAGTVFSYEEQRTPMQTMVSLAKGVKIKGDVFCTGMLKLEKEVAIEGKVLCNRFIMRTSQTLYENFLIDVAFNRKARSRYYLTSPIFGMRRENKVLKWLD